MNVLQKSLIVVGVSAGALYTAYWYGKKSNPPEVQVKIEEKIVEKIVTIEVEKKSEKKNTTTKIIEKPDGTKETIIEEKKETSSESSVKKDSDTKTNTNVEIVRKDNLSNYKLGVLVESKILDKEKRTDLLYTGTVGMRFLGPWWVDASIGFSEKTLGVGVSLEF
jgi:hypothetical protein